MAAEKRQRVEEVFLAAVDRDVEERAAFVEHACSGDDELRREVESLLGGAEGKSLVDRDPVESLAQGLDEQRPMLSIGESVGRYKVLDRIGEGGMGEVYLARDGSLGRHVALKLLPATSMLNRERLRRFEREALVTSSLNHPNIVTIHEVGQADALQYIVTEYVDGETLRARMSGKGIRLREALDISNQVAAALAAAHQAGVVHRDIKPENIMIRRDGYVKVLDFGLARLMEDVSWSASSVSEAPTEPAIKTNPGVVMGTAAYMSPEQARGLKVNALTDVWSLGVVIYEMVAGLRPFEGATHSDTIVSILEKEPAPLLRYAPEAPAELERIVTKALAKEMEERYQTIKDMAIDLRQLARRLEVQAELERSAQPAKGSAEQSSIISSDAQRGAAPTEIQAPTSVSETETARATSSVEYVITEIKRHKRGVAFLSAALVLSFAGLSYGIYKLFRRPLRLDPPFQTTRLTRLTTTGRSKLAAISPDGKYVVYAEQDPAQESLWVRQVATGSNVQIVPPADVGYWGLTFSNDSNYVFYIKNDKSGAVFNRLYQVPSLGGASRKLLDQVDSAVTFSPDGRRFAFVRDNLKREETEIMLANSDGSGERTLATRKAPDRFDSDFTTRIAWSPNGKIIACAASSADASGYYANVVAVTVGNGSEQPVTTERWGYTGQVVWLPGGKGLVMIAAEAGRNRTSSQLWYLSYPEGEARRITNDLNRYIDVSVTADSGALVTVQSNRTSNVWVAPKNDLTHARQITSGTLEGNQGVTWTPDGRLVYRSSASGKPDIWMMNADGSNKRQLTFDGLNYRPVVSPDGRYILFSSTRGGRPNIWRMDLDGGNEKQLTEGKSDGSAYPSADGRWVVYISMDFGNATLWKMPMDGGKAKQLSGPTVNLPVVSPDGKQIACFYWDEQANPARGVMILPFDGGPPTKRFRINSTPDAFVLHWSADSRAILFIDTKLANIWSQPIDGSPAVQLTDLQGDQAFNFDYSPDGKWLALARGTVTDDVVLIEDSRER